jgi:serine/threonine-protein kinase
MANVPPRPKPTSAPVGKAPPEGKLPTEAQLPSLSETEANIKGPAGSLEVTAAFPAGAAKPVVPPKPAEGQFAETLMVPGTKVSAPMNPNADKTEAGLADAPASPQEAADATSTLKDFRLLKKLGEGGMGTVYKAHQISLDRVVAVKVPFKHLVKDDAFIKRFIREARVMAKLDHPNILRCYSVGEESGWHYLAMEFIDGASMQSWLKQLGKLSVGDALLVTIACANALQHAHDQNLIHRDIKPDNILVTNKGVIKVADLGLAKALTDDLNLSQTGTGAGTPHYMAPEQARDAKHVDGRSDIYALGSMLYCFLTGLPPFKGETYVELLLAKEAGKFTPTRRSNAEIPERLDLMIDKAVAVKPEHRYKTCTEFANDLISLGLANDALSFIEGAVPASISSVKTSPATARSVPAPARAAASKPASAPAAVKAAPPPADVWFLATKTAKGQTVKRKLTTQQILAMIRDKQIDLEAQASRSLKGPYHHLQHFREFEPALRGRIEKAKADRKSEQFKGMYQSILKEEKSYHRWRRFKNLFYSVGGMVTLLIWLAVIGAILVGGYFGVKFLLEHFGDRLHLTT